MADKIPLIKVSNVSKSFALAKRARSPLTVLHEINLEVRTGEFLAIVGPSGAGKSTLLYIMGALDRPSSGTVYFNGENISKMKDRELTNLRLRHVGFVFQNYNLIPNLNALENIAVGQIMDPSLGRNGKGASEVLEHVGLAERSDHLPAQLSGGEQQRVAIARALFASPSVILADEPTGNLDTKAGEAIIKLFSKLNKKLGTAIVLVTHNTNLAKYAGRKVEMVDGRI
ncbi:MAG: ABC transporter ATP-binding protein [Thermoplasmata archaeon]|nr:MAG: ABC transporter ATP-binding protein [Thermoplasmata archaeon]